MGERIKHFSDRALDLTAVWTAVWGLLALVRAWRKQFNVPLIVLATVVALPLLMGSAGSVAEIIRNWEDIRPDARIPRGLPWWCFCAIASLLPLLMGVLCSGTLLGLNKLAAQMSVQGKCEKCGYDLTGNVSGICPECGATVPHQDCQLQGPGNE